MARRRRLEGHADNAAPALFGGLNSVIAGRGRDSGRACDGRGRDDLRLVVATPVGRSCHGEGAGGAAATRCRARTPSSTCSGCCRSCTRCSRATTTGCARPCKDRWHQPARASLVPLLARGAGARGSGRARRVPVGGRAVGCAARRAQTRRDVATAVVIDVRARRSGRDRPDARCGRPGRRRVPRASGSGEEISMKFVAGLTCHLCGATYPPKARWVCSDCLGPLEVTLRLRRDAQGDQPRADRVAPADRCGAISSCCRSRSRRPVSIPGSRRSCARRGWPRSSASSELYIKDDSVNHPTFSYKDRVVSVAATQGVELGFPRLRLRVHRAILPAASPRTPRASDCRATSSSRTISSRPRFSARRSIGRTSSPSKATTTM